MGALYRYQGSAKRVPTHASNEKRRPIIKRKVRIKFVYRNDHKHRLSMLTIITLMIIFAGAAGSAITYANVTVAKHRINTLTNDLRNKELLIKGLTEEASRSADTVAILEAARKMGMSEPKPHQIIHINVPDANYVEFNN